MLHRAFTTAVRTHAVQRITFTYHRASVALRAAPSFATSSRCTALPSRSFHTTMSLPAADPAAQTTVGASSTLSAESTPASDGGPMQQTIHRKLVAALSPSHLVIVNESYMHSGPRDAESHFKVTVISSFFDGLALLARHRLVNATLATELKSGIHALSITARTPTPWSADQTVAKSPACLGGSKHDKK